MKKSKTEPYKGYEIELNIVPGGVTAKIVAGDDFSRTADQMARARDGQMIILQFEAPKTDWDAEQIMNIAYKAAYEECERRFSLCDKPLPR